MYARSLITLLGTGLIARVHAGYWEFCSNDDSTDCGEGVSTGNDGCLQESGRQSLHLTEMDGGLYFPVLIGYSDSNCQTEIGCNTVGSDGTEQDINFNLDQTFKWALDANSFKFVSGSPPSCPSGCTGSCNAVERDMKRAKPKRMEKISEKEKRQDGADFWFCDDDNCSENCGARIEPNSAGCANGESGRGSVYFSGTGSSTWQLGGFDNDNCDGGPVDTVHAVQGCNVLSSQHNSWQTLGVSS